MKTLFILSALLPCLLSAKTPTRILAPVESPSKVIEGIEFSVVTQSEWRNVGNSFHSSESVTESVILQLRITNRTDSAILFPTFDSFGVRLKAADGSSVSFGGGRDGTAITPNILLQPKSSFSLPINATLEYKRDGKAVKLIVRDGTGSIDWATLTAGAYSVFFEVRPTHYEFEKEAKLPAPLWAGKGVTEPIGFKLNSP